MIRWLALIVLVLAIVLIIARLKLPMPERRSESTITMLRRWWRHIRERREDIRAREDDLMALRGRKALLVDPDEKSARVMQWKLDSLGCRVTKARNGVQGLVIAREQAPDLVIADALLPDMRADEFYRSLGRPEAPVVFVGVMASHYDELRSLGPRVACLAKPYDPEEAAALAGYMLPR